MSTTITAPQPDLSPALPRSSPQPGTLTPLMLRDQRILVVGGTSGMGLGAVQAALDAGASTVVVAGRRPLGERR